MALSQTPFPIRNRMKQGCIPAPTLLSILISLLLSYAFSQSKDSIYLCTRSDGSLFSLPCLWAKTKVLWVLIRELLLQTMLPWLHTLGKLYSKSSAASNIHAEFGLTINLKKTNIMDQDLSSIPSISLRWWISPTLVPQSPATSPWMLNWTHGLERQWQQWLALQRGPGKTPCWP